jgi:hypothetical protein
VDEQRPAPTSSRPPYLHIADVLRGEIIDGLFPVGQRIPSQDELAERFNVSRPTVQRALGELRKDGFLDNQRGRSAEVLPWREGAGGAAAADHWEPGRAFNVLGRHITEAFQAPDVTIDVFSLTTETLNAALVAPLQRIMSGGPCPESITVRVLLPGLDAQLAIPQPVEGRPLERLRELIRSHVITLNSSLSQLDLVAPGVARPLQVRTARITPLHKLYVLNGHTALFGYYSVFKRDIVYGSGERREIYDSLGLTAPLFPTRGDPENPESRDSRFVTESLEWFDSLWSTVAEPMDNFT